MAKDGHLHLQILLDDHLQLTGVVEHLKGNGIGGHLLCLSTSILLIGIFRVESVLLLGIESSLTTVGVLGQTCLTGLEEEETGGFRLADALVGLLDAAANVDANCVQEKVDEVGVVLRGDVSFRKEDLVVASLHEVLLQRDRVADVDVVLNLRHWQKLELLKERN